MTKSDVTIVSVGFQSAAVLDEMLSSVPSGVPVVFVDNNSGDGSQELLEREYSRYALFSNQQNLGYCGGANLGIRQAQGEYVLLLNPDVILEPDVLQRLLAAAQQRPDAGIFAGKLLRFDRNTLDSTGQFLRRNLTPLERGYNQPDRGQYSQAGAVFSACGAAAFYRRAMLEDICLHGDYFDESYFAFYEDLDIGWRAQLFGWKACYVPDAVIYHYRGGGLSGQTRTTHWFESLPFVPKFSFFRKPLFVQQHIILNRYLTLLKNASWRDLFFSIPALLKLDLLLWGYVVCTRPVLSKTIWEFLKLLPATLEKRREIQRRRVVSSAYLRKYIQRDN